MNPIASINQWCEQIDHSIAMLSGQKTLNILKNESQGAKLCHDLSETGDKIITLIICLTQTCR